MARFLLGDEWFDQLSSTALYESEYERLLLSNARALFPDYHVVEFKPIVQSEYGTAKPDLALVDRELRLWWVVEVELAHHSLNGHVLPQVEILTAGHYGSSEAELLTQSIPELDSEAASDLVKGAQPPVLVIVNHARSGWHEAIAQLGASLMIAEIFRSGRNAHAIRVNGTYPTIAGDFVSDCILDRSLPGLLVVQSPARLDASQGARLEIEISGTITQWTRLDVQDRVWLKPHGGDPLEGRRGPFRLSHNEDRLLLE